MFVCESAEGGRGQARARKGAFAAVAETGDVGGLGAVGDGFTVEGAVAVGVAMTMAMPVLMVASVRGGDGGDGADAAEAGAVLEFWSRLQTRLVLGKAHRVADVASVEAGSAAGHGFNVWGARWTRQVGETGRQERRVGEEG